MANKFLNNNFSAVKEVRLKSVLGGGGMAEGLPLKYCPSPCYINNVHDKKHIIQFENGHSKLTTRG